MNEHKGKWFARYSSIYENIYFGQIEKSKQESPSSVTVEVLSVKSLIKVDLKNNSVFSRDEFEFMNAVNVNMRQISNREIAQRRLIDLIFKHI